MKMYTIFNSNICGRKLRYVFRCFTTFSLLALLPIVDHFTRDFFTHIEITPLPETAEVGRLKWNLGSPTGIFFVEIGTVALEKKILKVVGAFLLLTPLGKGRDPAVIWLKYCRYGLKHFSINQFI